MSETEEPNVPEEPEPEDEVMEAQDEPPAEEPAKPEQPTQPVSQMKVVIVVTGSNLLLGVQSTDCDPLYRTMKGSLSQALKAVPGLVAEAKKQWETTPRYPKANLPEPAPRPTPARTPASPRSTEPRSQPSFF